MTSGLTTGTQCLTSGYLPASQHASRIGRALPIVSTVSRGVAQDADWTSYAACRDGDPDELFVTGAAQNKAKVRCLSCVVRPECLADALDNRVEVGVWGGMTERERRALLRRRPDVTSWTALLTEARREFGATA
jgi:WhiB family transcriptional regulator, redox-sensing transcriptional regulator